MARFGPAVMSALAALLVGASTAGAATVGNPGPFTATFGGGELRVLGSASPVPFLPTSPVSAAGTIDENGNISVPAPNLTFPAVHADLAPLPESVDFQLVSDGASGTLDPSSGAASVTAHTHVVAVLSGLVNDNCRIGTPSAPLELPLTTGASGAQTGTPYSAVDGTLTLVSTFALSGALDCDTDANEATVAGVVRSASNDLKLSGRLTPVIKAPGASGSSGPGAGLAGCTVPKLKGLRLAPAKKALKAAGCKPGNVAKKKSKKKKGTVIAQSPKAGATLAAGSKVALTVSDGPPKKKRKKK